MCVRINVFRPAFSFVAKALLLHGRKGFELFKLTKLHTSRPERSLNTVVPAYKSFNTRTPHGSLCSNFIPHEL